MGGTGPRNRGNQADYMLGTAEGWNAFGVVRWHGIEELAQPYRYDITLQRQASQGPVELDKLIDTGATFRIASQDKWRVVHGILAEAEEIDRTAQLILYRVLLVPHFWRARYRRRCRNFLDQSLVDIVSAVLENRSPAHPAGKGGLTRFSSAGAPELHPSFSSFTAPTASYRWDVKDTSRIESRAVRPYVVQYNESDFDFVARLLEDEGLTYYFEHGQSEVTLAITDEPGVSPMFEGNAATFTLRRHSLTGTSQAQEIVRSFRDARRLRSRAVKVRDWDYHRSGAPLEATDQDPGVDPDLAGHFEFPVGEEAVQEHPGLHAAKVRRQRYDAERAMREGSSNVRTMVPGYRFTLQDGDGLTADAKLLTVRVETFATELAPQGTTLDEEPWGFADATGAPTAGFDSRFVALDEATPFRPAMRTRRPRIHGVQPAVVTAEEYAPGDRPAINGDELARVRVRFPWDQRDDTSDKTPTSCWIRVSQHWAGAGYGALYMPRVGHEVLVAYMQGDPDDPVIVGRVYNVQHPPPYDAKKEPNKSTLKSQSAEVKKEVDGFNELRFDDTAKKEEIYLHAQRDLNEVVLGSHSTSVGGSQTNTVWYFREHTVHDYETVTVFDDRTTLFKANEHHTVLGSRDTHIGINEENEITGHRNTRIGANETRDVKGFRQTTIGVNEYLHVKGYRHVEVDFVDKLTAKAREIHVKGEESLHIDGDHAIHVQGGDKLDVDKDYALHAANVTIRGDGKTHVLAADFDVDAGNSGFKGKHFSVKAGSASVLAWDGNVVLDSGGGATISICGGKITITGDEIVLKSGNIKLDP